MNHDACHCLGYKKGSCPESCYRARLTQEYLEMQAAGKVDFYTSWSDFSEKDDCERKGKDNG